VFIFSSILALIAYVLALTRYWWGPNSNFSAEAERDTCSVRETFLVKVVIVVLAAVLLAAGAWPGLLQFVQGGR
jgi:fumarate reductase subunit C